MRYLKGKSALLILTDILPRRQIYFGIYDLKYAAKSGRIPKADAFLGTALNMKPVMNIFDRFITTAAKCRGERKLVEKVAEMSIDAMEPGSPYEIVYGSDSPDGTDHLSGAYRRTVCKAGADPFYSRRLRQSRSNGGKTA